MILLKLDSSELREQLRLSQRALFGHWLIALAYLTLGLLSIGLCLAFGLAHILLGILGQNPDWSPFLGFLMLIGGLGVAFIMLITAKPLNDRWSEAIVRENKARNALDRATFVDEKSTHVSP